MADQRIGAKNTAEIAVGVRLNYKRCQNDNADAYNLQT